MTSRTEYCTQTQNKPSIFDVQYLRNHRTLDIGVLGYIGIVWPKKHSPEVRSFPPGTPCIKRTTQEFLLVNLNACVQQVHMHEVTLLGSSDTSLKHSTFSIHQRGDTHRGRSTIIREREWEREKKNGLVSTHTAIQRNVAYIFAL